MIGKYLVLKTPPLPLTVVFYFYFCARDYFNFKNCQISFCSGALNMGNGKNIKRTIFEGLKKLKKDQK
jgi:hypothetical protein